jgi:hypothetical protein
VGWGGGGEREREREREIERERLRGLAATLLVSSFRWLWSKNILSAAMLRRGVTHYKLNHQLN